MMSIYSLIKGIINFGASLSLWQKIEKLKSRLQLLDGADKPKGAHLVFLDSKQEGFLKLFNSLTSSFAFSCIYRRIFHSSLQKNKWLYQEFVKIKFGQEQFYSLSLSFHIMRFYCNVLVLYHVS